MEARTAVLGANGAVPVVYAQRAKLSFKQEVGIHMRIGLKGADGLFRADLFDGTGKRSLMRADFQHSRDRQKALHMQKKFRNPLRAPPAPAHVGKVIQHGLL